MLLAQVNVLKVNRLENHVHDAAWRAGVFSRILMSRESSKGTRGPLWVFWGLLTELTHEKVCERWNRGR